MTDEVLFTVEGALGRIVLNRPRALNALTLGMVAAVDHQLQAWADNDAVEVVSIEGAGERGLCAGGDVVAVRRAVAEGTDGQKFFEAEYAMNARLAHFAKPIVAFQDGFVLGGGVGISAHCGVRLATERTKVAMPETIIGFFPDVGALHLLAAAPGELGTHLALTGATISGADAVYAGLSDTLVDSSDWSAILDAMRSGEVSYTSVEASSELAAERNWIDECYAGDDPVRIVERLSGHPSAQAQAAAKAISQRSPYAVCVTLLALRRAATLGSVDAVLAQDLALAQIVSSQPDFAEGVRAQLVDKDRAPRWAHGSLAEALPQARRDVGSL
ncbi:3-hydroxyisobutyryl-CoA hydrolase [Calidifontibacter terrae]